MMNHVTYDNAWRLGSLKLANNTKSEAERLAVVPAYNYVTEYLCVRLRKI